MTPTSRYVAIDSNISQKQWDVLSEVIANKQKELSKCRYGDIEATLWLMEQIEYLKEMYRYHKERFTKDLDIAKVS
jgi:hypothetical protein